ncbi:MAG: UDP-N-acetylglucosamine 2-epimerase (non-hydrolyzing) [Methylococcaceae bacterium]|nr:UDP-N-acetylglucosamine 2-epimerase (non-hydrolyzing) [Methylococcaceae bacterium]
MSKDLPTVLCVVGARPNFMKIAPIYACLLKYPEVIRAYLVHTGQHYDETMKDAFFRQLGIPEPNIDLEVGSGRHAVQTAQIMLKFEPVLDAVNPCCVLVVGDVNSTIACSLVAVKKQIPIIHVEAGLRSHDRTMPEEINRILTDQLSDLLFTTEESALQNLLAEGIAADKVHFVGNVMIDSLLTNLERAIPVADILKNHQAEMPWTIEPGKGYAVLTLHRPSNVDDTRVFEKILRTVRDVSCQIPVIFTVHPRTRKMIDQAGLGDLLNHSRILCLPPVPYLEMLGLLKDACMVLTDSGGLQEETTALGIPCITLRENTERPITIDQGTNTVVGSDPEKIRRCVTEILESGGKAGQIPRLWDGRSAERIVEIIKRVIIDPLCASHVGRDIRNHNRACGNL